MTMTAAEPTTTATEATTAAAQVRRFYRLVDIGDVAGMAALFTAGSSYHRPGYPPMTGPQGMTRFYTTERVIREGSHSIEAVVVTGDEVAVRGGFRGVRHDGTPVDLRFADFFTVAADGRFSRRETFFFAPLA